MKEFRPFAGMTRIRFEGSPPDLKHEAADSQPLTWGSPRNDAESRPLAPPVKRRPALGSGRSILRRQARFRRGRLERRVPVEAALAARRGLPAHICS